MKSISINCGHTLSGKGTGAYYKGFNESEIVRAVGYELIDILKRKGYKVYNSTIDNAESQNDYLKKAVKLVNDSNVDLAISLHCNASSTHKGSGTEIYCWNGTHHKEAVNILKSFNNFGFRNRGIKRGNDLYFIKKTNAKAILIELFFLDSELDRKLYLELGHKQLARMIYYAIAS